MIFNKHNASFLQCNRFVRQIHPCFVSLLLIRLLNARRCVNSFVSNSVRSFLALHLFLLSFEMISSRVSEVKLRVTRSTRDCFQIETKRVASLRTSSTTTTMSNASRCGDSIFAS